MPFQLRRLALSTLLATTGFIVAPGCASDDDDTAGTGATCTSKGGPVDGPADTHCVADGQDIIHPVGECLDSAPGAAGGGGASGASGSGTGGHAGEHVHEHDHDHAEGSEEPYEIRFGNESADDECKYDASFLNTCIVVNKPVTFNLTLRNRTTGNPANGAHPDSPEIFLASNPSHISPSNAIKAPEGPLGTYAIGPIVFDVPGRWVVRFHYFEDCSDVPEDSPHGHVSFYIDVP
jgi:hypothetical protein